ncbi:MAG: nodulation protein NfeD [Sulfuritalea sp.]|nr:nodulation protein NfeD [Sulfuritalea sp.]
MPIRLILLLLLALSAGSVQARPVVVLTVQGAISPASADYAVRGLRHAAEADAQLVVLKLDTPGGLDDSMRDINRAILASPAPVAVFVSPQGARAASAGTYILYASHIAVMAPATHLGAATPVTIGAPPPGRDRPVREPAGEKGEDEPGPARAATPEDARGLKQIHDASAYIRGLAQLRGRNAEWAERAVREAASLPAEQALEEKVIDLIAADLNDLLARVDGRTVQTAHGTVTLATKGATLIVKAPDWRSRLLAVIGNPSVAYILLLIGLYGLIIEFTNPGLGVPGVVGGVSLLLALFALNLLPVNYAGLALILLGAALMVAEIFAPSFGILGLGGLAAFVAGSVMLIDTDVPGYGLPWGLILAFTLTTVLFMSFVVGMALKSRRRPVVTGAEEMAGSPGVVLEDCNGEGWARVHGEIWRVRCPVPLRRDGRVRVVQVNGLILEVEPIEGE